MDTPIPILSILMTCHKHALNFVIIRVWFTLNLVTPLENVLLHGPTVLAWYDHYISRAQPIQIHQVL